MKMAIIHMVRIFKYFLLCKLSICLQVNPYTTMGELNIDKPMEGQNLLTICWILQSDFMTH